LLSGVVNISTEVASYAGPLKHFVLIYLLTYFGLLGRYSGQHLKCCEKSHKMVKRLLNMFKKFTNPYAML